LHLLLAQVSFYGHLASSGLFDVILWWWLVVKAQACIAATFLHLSTLIYRLRTSMQWSCGEFAHVCGHDMVIFCKELVCWAGLSGICFVIAVTFCGSATMSM